MEILLKLSVAFVAVEHLFILYIEMFAWKTLGRKIFKDAIEDSLFDKTQTIAANQGLYNGFIAAGLFWALLVHDAEWQNKLFAFFLICVVLAGVYGASTLSKKIFFTQAVPAIVALVILCLINLNESFI
jgi:putative membrane protein